jgi:hypothetical protein
VPARRGMAGRVRQGAGPRVVGAGPRPPPPPRRGGRAPGGAAGGPPPAGGPAGGGPTRALIAREFPDWSPYPWGVREATELVVKHVLFAQAMLPEYAERFRGLGDDELDDLADSFALDRCRRRARLCDIIASRMGAVA